MCVYIYIYTHTHIYIYIYIYFVTIRLANVSNSIRPHAACNNLTRAVLDRLTLDQAAASSMRLWYTLVHSNIIVRMRDCRLPLRCK